MRYLYFDLVFETPKRIEIYLSGCLQKCKNCHNPESWNFDSGFLVDYTLKSKLGDYSLYSKLYEYKHLYNDIWILGGEPLDQDINELCVCLDRLKCLNKKMWLWTSYELGEVDPRILEYFDYVKCGKYIDDESEYLTEYGFKLASSNQKIYKLK